MAVCDKPYNWMRETSCGRAADVGVLTDEMLYRVTEKSLQSLRLLDAATNILSRERNDREKPMTRHRPLQPLCPKRAPLFLLLEAIDIPLCQGEARERKPTNMDEHDGAMRVSCVFPGTVRTPAVLPRPSAPDHARARSRTGSTTCRPRAGFRCAAVLPPVFPPLSCCRSPSIGVCVPLHHPLYVQDIVGRGPVESMQFGEQRSPAYSIS